MYNQANGISDFYSKNAYNLSDKNFDYNASMKSFMLPEDFTLWIVDIHGTILYSSSPRDIGGNIGEFTDYFDNKFYTTTKYDNILPEEVLSVYSSIANNYKTYGYRCQNDNRHHRKSGLSECVRQRAQRSYGFNCYRQQQHYGLLRLCN